MEILAISGSIREASYNTALLHAVSNLSPADINISIYEGLKDIPIFNPLLEPEEYPAPVQTLIERLRKSDGLIISAPEYAHGISGVLKNMLDWLVATDAVVIKPVVVTSVSTSGLGGVRGFNVVVQILTAMNAHVVIDGALCVPYASKKFDADLNLIDPLTKDALNITLKALERAVELAKVQTS